MHDNARTKRMNKNGILRNQELELHPFQGMGNKFIHQQTKNVEDTTNKIGP